MISLFHNLKRILFKSSFSPPPKEIIEKVTIVIVISILMNFFLRKTKPLRFKINKPFQSTKLSRMVDLQRIDLEIWFQNWVKNSNSVSSSRHLAGSTLKELSTFLRLNEVQNHLKSPKVTYPLFIHFRSWHMQLHVHSCTISCLTGLMYSCVDEVAYLVSDIDVE